MWCRPGRETRSVFERKNESMMQFRMQPEDYQGCGTFIGIVCVLAGFWWMRGLLLALYNWL